MALLRLVLFGIGIVIVGANGYAADVRLGWDPNQEADLAGYGVYYKQGTNGPPYDFFGYVAEAELSNANSPVFTVTGLQQDTTYYFAVTAFDASDSESAYSASVCAQVGAVVTPCGSTPTTPTTTTPTNTTNPNTENSSSTVTPPTTTTPTNTTTPNTQNASSSVTPPASSASGGGGGGGCFIQAILP